MKHIIVGTNRPNSRSLSIAKIILGIYQEMGESARLIELDKAGLELLTGAQYAGGQPEKLSDICREIESSDGLIFVVPEYNGSFPGALKYFIDHWSYPAAFEYRPVCFVGLGWQWGGLRAVEHLQQIMGYRNAYAFPQRVFIQNIGGVLSETGVLKDEIVGRLRGQAQGFSTFVRALRQNALDANSQKAAGKKD